MRFHSSFSYYVFISTLCICTCTDIPILMPVSIYTYMHTYILTCFVRSSHAHNLPGKGYPCPPQGFGAAISGRSAVARSGSTKASAAHVSCLVLAVETPIGSSVTGSTCFSGWDSESHDPAGDYIAISGSKGSRGSSRPPWVFYACPPMGGNILLAVKELHASLCVGEKLKATGMLVHCDHYTPWRPHASLRGLWLPKPYLSSWCQSLEALLDTI